MIGVLTRKSRRLLARAPFGARHECNLCHHRLRRFLPYRGGWRDAPPLMRALRITGSDLDHYLCPWCGANDRERHLLAYLEATGIWAELRGKSLLHFAPEPRLGAMLCDAGLDRLVRGDLFPASADVQRIDMLAIPFPDESFDFVIANHVLEHVDDDVKALSELHRVLRRGGRCILQTPFSAVLAHTVSDPGVATSEARLQLYGQEDHVRLYGRDIFARFASVGLTSQVRRHDEVLAAVDAARFGFNPEEPLFLFARL